MKKLLSITPLIFTLFSCQTMRYKTYSIPKQNITFTYPASWTDTVESEKTYLFYDEKLGSFRLTPFKLENTNLTLEAYLNSEYEENKSIHPQWLKLGEHRTLYYKQKAALEDNTIIHYFLTGKGSTVLVTSFAYDDSLDGSAPIDEELNRVKETLASLQLK